MTTLTTRADLLVGDIEKLSQLKEAAQRLKEYQQRRDHLQGVLAELRPPARFLALLAQRDIPVVPASSSPSIGVFGQTSALAQRYASDPAAVLGNEFAALLKALKGEKEQLTSRARASWKAFSDPLVRAVPRELLDALEKVDAFRATVQALRSHQKPIEELGGKDWVEEHDLNRFLSLVERRKETWDELEVGGAMSEDVIAFLKQCNKGGARLDTLKSETIDWLRARGILGCFRVVL